MLRLLLTLRSVAWAWADDIITADDENTPVVDIISQHLGTVGPPDPKRVKRSMMMSRAAAEAWANVVLDAPNGTRYFEWGSGGSTEAAAYAARGRRGPVRRHWRSRMRDGRKHRMQRYTQRTGGRAVQRV